MSGYCGVIQRVAVLGLFAWAGLVSGDLFAEDSDHPAVIDPAVAAEDPDFLLQGEFVGHWSSGDKSGEKFGLQVASEGNGNFRVLEYTGGLPGGGWNKWDRRWWGGHRIDNQLSLYTKGLIGTIEGNSGKILDESGAEVATLKRVVRRSSTLGATPPEDAVVLFDGTDTDEFEMPKITEDGLLCEGTVTKRTVGDFKLHIEFMTPYQPFATGQGRGNSGVYMQERYELQILDSFGLVGRFNECGALYRTEPPFENMCLPPLTWQTYDIDFTAARFDESGAKVSPTTISVRHNGVLIHDNYEMPNKTGAGKPEGPENRPIKLQDHSNPVRFRNIWLIEEELIDDQQGEEPCCGEGDEHFTAR